MHEVLIVDDEPLVREVIRSLGEWPAFEVTQVHEAPDAMAALELLGSTPAIDIILTDMKMPEMDGTQFLKELGRRSWHKALIAISGYSDFEFTRQAILSKAVDYILKPIVAEDLHAALSAAVAFIEAGQTPVLPEDTSKAEPSSMDPVREYLDEYFLERMTLGDLAQRFSLSREHLSRQFKRAFGVNLFDYLALRKIEAAKKRLRESNDAIKSIAYDLGYDDEHYFSKAFRRLTNVTPSEFRMRRM